MGIEKKPLVVLVGPTAVGKTALSIDLAEHFHAEVISGDSMQVYRKMDIGTAKISENETRGIPHHLIDVVDPDEEFNALQFKTLAELEIDQILSRNHLPMIVGGTGLYVNGLIYNYQFTGERDNSYRDEIYDSMHENKENDSYEELMRIRPDLKGIIFPNDHFRIARALEIIKTDGQENLKNFDMKNNYQSPYNLCLMGLNMNRSTLYDRINKRVDLMIEDGLVEEVEMLLQQGYNKEMKAFKAIGYKEIISYLDGTLSYEEAINLLKKNTRHFAKRQLTWFRRDPNINWFFVDEMSYDELLKNTIDCINKHLNL